MASECGGTCVLKSAASTLISVLVLGSTLEKEAAQPRSIFGQHGCGCGVVCSILIVSSSLSLFPPYRHPKTIEIFVHLPNARDVNAMRSVWPGPCCAPQPQGVARGQKVLPLMKLFGTIQPIANRYRQNAKTFGADFFILLLGYSF